MYTSRVDGNAKCWDIQRCYNPGHTLLHTALAWVDCWAHMRDNKGRCTLSNGFSSRRKGSTESFSPSARNSVLQLSHWVSGSTYLDESSDLSVHAQKSNAATNKLSLWAHGRIEVTRGWRGELLNSPRATRLNDFCPPWHFLFFIYAPGNLDCYGAGPLIYLIYNNYTCVRLVSKHWRLYCRYCTLSCWNHTKRSIIHEVLYAESI